MPKKDIADLDELSVFIRRFYGDIAQDELLGPMFNDVAQVDWSAHVPKLTAFWARVLFGIEGYVGNPFAAHAHIHAQEPFTPAHFHRWLELFEETLSEWSGPNIDRLTQIAHNVARVHSNQLLGEPIETTGGELHIGRPPPA